MASELNGSNPWRALRLARQWASLPGLADGERADALIQEAGACAEIGDYAGAETALSQALKARPGDPEASYLLAEATRDRPEQALTRAEDAAKAAGPARRRAAAYRLSAQIRLDLGDADGARAALDRALELAPDDVATLALASAARRAEPGTAAKLAKAACAAADSQPAWRRSSAERVCARALADAKDYAGAMTALGKALSIELDDADTLREMVRVRRLSPAEALPSVAAAAPDAIVTPAQARRALAEDPDDLAALAALFDAERAAGHKREAAELAERFTSSIRRSDHWQRLEAYRRSAQQWIDLGEPKNAIGSLFRAEDLDAASVPNEKLIVKASGRAVEGPISEAYDAAAKLRVALGDPAGADATLERGLKLSPDSQYVLQLMVERKLTESKPLEALPYAERQVAAAEKAAQPASWNPEKRGVVSGADAAREGDLANARRTLEMVRKAIAAKRTGQ
ncbi:MAG: tetratricopeptide repeat protein [Elusimicrobiota bacterium]